MDVDEGADTPNVEGARTPNVGALLAFIAFVLTILLATGALLTGNDPWMFVLFAYLAAVVFATAMV